jgi:putative methanogenesis marker protein 8
VSCYIRTEDDVLSKKIELACRNACGIHEICCCGSHVKIDEKAITVLTEPAVTYCPLHESLYGTKKIDAQAVKKSIETKIEGFGFCCRDRDFSFDSIVAYGASETVSVWLDKGLIDYAVVVCDGAGTVITNSGKLVQGIGARLTGIIKTSPIREVIEHIEKNGGAVLDKTEARIDQVAGVKQAFMAGAKHVAVSVASFQAKAISHIRRLEKIEGKEAVIFSVCNTLAKKSDVKHIVKADIVCASASTILRNAVGSRALLQVGVTIPVYALSIRGKELILDYLAAFKEKLVAFRASKLPYEIKNRGPERRGIAHEQKHQPR